MTDGNTMGTVVHNKSSAFYPLTKSFINLVHNTREVDFALNNPAQYLANTGNFLENPSVRFNPEDIRRIRSLRDDLIRSLPEKRVNEIIRNHYPRQVENGILEVLDIETPLPDLAIVQNVFNGDVDVMRQVALNRIEWSNLSSEGSSVTRLSERGGVDYSTARRLGFQDIVYIEEFPMVIANIGYKRARDQDYLDDAELIPNPTENGRVQVFTEIFTTEAIFFTLDNERLERWVTEWSGLPILSFSNLPSSLSLISSMAREHRNIRECDELRATQGIRDPLGHYLLTLLHTLAHASILACSIKSGFQTNSLGEYISPGTLGFYVYVNKMYESGLGGLENLFNRDMCGVLHKIETSTIDCFHDPHCRNRTDSACHACVVLSETTCREFNSHLDRKTLHGDQVNRKTGYFSFQR
jgi:hypothetical protein